MIKPENRHIHFVYKIILEDSDKYYIGRHSTDNIDDGYMGSGNWVKKIKDKSKLSRIILCECKTFSELLIMEEQYIKNYFGDPNNMNMAFTACGASPGELNVNYKRQFSDEHRQNLSNSRTGTKNHRYGKKFPPRSSETKQKISDKLTGIKLSDERKSNISLATKGVNNHNYGKVMSREQKDKISNTLRGMMVGEKSPASKLTNQVVLDIRFYYDNKTHNQKELSLTYDVNISTIQRICSRKTWSHI